MTTPSTPTFADFLRDARTAAGLTQEDLASKSGLHVNTVQKYEAGKNHPSAESAERLAAALALAGAAREQMLGYATPEAQSQTISHLAAAVGALHHQLARVEARLAELERRDGQRHQKA